MEKLSGKVAEMTALEWKELGFFYSSDDLKKRWDLYGSLSGLAKLSEELSNFIKRDEKFGGHEPGLSKHLRAKPCSVRVCHTALVQQRSTKCVVRGLKP